MPQGLVMNATFNVKGDMNALTQNGLQINMYSTNWLIETGLDQWTANES